MIAPASWLLSIGLSVLVAFSAESGQPESLVTVAGSQVRAGVYAISIETALEAPGEYDGLLIWAEPSHTLLLAQAGGQRRTPPLEPGERPLAQVSGPLAVSAPSVQLRYEVGGDTRVVVQLLRGADRLTIADARVSLAAFELSTAFSGPIDDPLLMKIRHCVTCDPCGTMCEECTGPRFTANCVECWIRCGW